ncbi:MAG: hypothetical protein LBI55_03970 [Oscillospiraceae bacterium]|nr:hypothetical protein [Oscillospiraceae bacterium]
MKKLVVCCICVAVTCLLTSVMVTSISLSFVGKNHKEEKINSKNFEEQKDLPSYEDEDLPLKDDDYIDSEEPLESSLAYIVKDYNGKVAVFEKDKIEPFKITDCLVSHLPNYDQRILKDGIEVKTELELERLLEDYCS